MKLLRRIHLYAGLFLAPWVLMYAISTIAMNHRELFREEATSNPQWQKRSESRFSGVLSTDASIDQRATTILAWLGQDGAYNARWQAQRGALVIQRQRLMEQKELIGESKE
ncbi:MAG TPA: hypothetical protein PKJ41_07355, partial [Bryobacteraceae bacterium]|nr:hypothetical protein [Bryobacteraceae bacterium]